MSGKGPSVPDVQSKYTKPLAKELEHGRQHNDSDAQFKKTTQVVGKPGLTDHNHNDDAIKNPPNNHGDAPRDTTVGSDAERNAANDVQPNTVEAKPVDEIKARIGQKD